MFIRTISETEILPYRFELDVISFELDSEAHLSTVSTDIDVADHRIGNTDWAFSRLNGYVNKVILSYPHM